MARPPLNPEQDRAALGGALERVGGKLVTAYNEEKAIEIVERVSLGETVVDITREEGMPSRSTFYRWALIHGELKTAFDAARELSAAAFEEEALGLARSMVIMPGSNTKVRAYDVAMGQLRWSAARRDPARFGDKAQVSVKVPVQIITSLALTPGTVGELPMDQSAVSNIYSLSAEVKEPIEAEFSDVPAEPEEPPAPTMPPERTLYTKPPQENPGHFAKGHHIGKGVHLKKVLTPRIGKDERSPMADRHRRIVAKREAAKKET